MFSKTEFKRELERLQNTTLIAIFSLHHYHHYICAYQLNHLFSNQLVTNVKIKHCIKRIISVKLLFLLNTSNAFFAIETFLQFVLMSLIILDWTQISFSFWWHATVLLIIIIYFERIFSGSVEKILIKEKL